MSENAERELKLNNSEIMLKNFEFKSMSDETTISLGPRLLTI